jgi:uncharacterized membrane protein
MALNSVVLVVLVVLALVVVAAVVAAVVLSQRKQRSQAMQERFGPEYDRTVQQRGDQREAERALAERQERREALDIRELDPARRERYAAAWSDVQKRFVDEPAAAVGDANTLVRQVMAELGYPTDDVEQQADLVSVDHPEVVEDYRAANRVTQASGHDQVGTEQLREAMVHYRSLFTRLLGTGTTHDQEAR